MKEKREIKLIPDLVTPMKNLVDLMKYKGLMFEMLTIVDITVSTCLSMGLFVVLSLKGAQVYALLFVLSTIILPFWKMYVYEQIWKISIP